MGVMGVNGFNVVNGVNGVPGDRINLKMRRFAPAEVQWVLKNTRGI